MPDRRRSFLSARWCNLILANYSVPEELLLPFVPPGCQLDQRDGKYWVSLVGFQFLGTRVLGIGWPGFRNFPEWNLRFYVHQNGQRGVCFVREFVPSWLVATTARVLYNEPYRSARMTMDVKDSADTLTATYTVKWRGKVHSLQAVGAKPVMRPGLDTTERWSQGTLLGLRHIAARQIDSLPGLPPGMGCIPRSGVCCGCGLVCDVWPRVERDDRNRAHKRGSGSGFRSECLSEELASSCNEAAQFRMRNVIRPLVKSYGDTSNLTRSPGMILM